jgi:plasmid stabilization system protein ParE
MRIAYSRPAARDLHDIIEYQRTEWPATIERFAARLGAVEELLSAHPNAAAAISERTNVRTIMLRPFPYRMFYRVLEDKIEILHIRHTSRRVWPGLP